MDSERFIRKICHDLRAPIRALKTLPDWLEADLRDIVCDPPDHIQEALDMMKVQASRLDTMIAGLSELQQLGRQEEAPWTGLTELLESMKLPDNLTIRANADGLPLEHEHAHAIIHHLVDNAYRHAIRPDIRVELSVSQQANSYEIAVTDNGPGIASGDVRTVYEPLTTLRPRDEVEGSGMGLAVVSRLARLYGGEAEIIPNPAGGTISCFRVLAGRKGITGREYQRSLNAI